jgi:hypothetical protein
MEAQPTCSRDEWVERFSTRFRALQPLVSLAQAVEVASAAFPTANDIEPEEAAAVFGEILDASVPLKEVNRWLR